MTDVVVSVTGRALTSSVGSVLASGVNRQYKPRPKMVMPRPTYGPYDPGWAERLVQIMQQHIDQTYAALQQLDTTLLKNCANDTEAALSGVLVGGLYRNGSVLMVRVS
jgi:hypothetical protein